MNPVQQDRVSKRKRNTMSDAIELVSSVDVLNTVSPDGDINSAYQNVRYRRENTWAKIPSAMTTRPLAHYKQNFLSLGFL